jgi:DNA replication and repair protein RecF
MSIKNLALHNIRSYETYSTKLDPRVTLILGPNGVGKTTLLEGIYYLCQGTSFRGRDRDMIAHSKQFGELKLVGADAAERRSKLNIIEQDKIQKTFFINNKKTARIPLQQRLPVVLFEPNELRLLSSSPQRRRDFFDGIIARLSPTYQTLLNRYNRTLLQRNELLKRQSELTHEAWSNHLFAWDVKFAELAQKIVSHRQEFLHLSNQRLSGIYSKMADKDHSISAAYHSNLPKKNYQQNILHTLHRNVNADAIRGYTSVGPHRDDILISLDEHVAVESASRGEMRTIMLSYKLLEVNLQANTHHTPPLILMDDVFSELDQTREEKLMNAIKDYQTIITATDLRESLKIDASIISLPIR